PELEQRLTETDRGYGVSGCAAGGQSSVGPGGREGFGVDAAPHNPPEPTAPAGTGGTAPPDGTSLSPSDPADPVRPAGAYRVVRDPADLSMVLAALDESVRVGIDCETTGLDPRTDRVRLLSLATDRGVYVLDCFAVDPRPLFGPLAALPLLGHNLLFD